jgi:hypothetical protein
MSAVTPTAARKWTSPEVRVGPETDLLITSYARASSISEEGVQILRCGRVPYSSLDKKLEDGSGECCRITIRPIVLTF